MLFLTTTVNGVQMGLCYAVLALGLYISFAILNVPDLSVDGVFPLGGVIATILMLRLGLPPLLAILLSFFAGVLAGSVTGVLHVKFHISELLSGIIVMTALLSVTLALTRLLTKNGQTTTIFSFLSEKLKTVFHTPLYDSLSPDGKDYYKIAVLLLIVLAMKFALDLFFKTRAGYMLRATGANDKVVVGLGRDAGNYKILGLALADGIVAVSGAVYANLFQQYDNTCGTGKLVLALASVMIGMSVFAGMRLPNFGGKNRRLRDTTAVIFGSVIYALLLHYLALVDHDGIYLKLLNALLFAVILIFHDKISAFLNRSRARRQGGTDDTPGTH